MKKTSYMIAIIINLLFLTGCAKNTLKTPCPNFGAHCRKVPINVWNYQA